MAPGGQTITEALPGGDTMTFSVALSGVRMRPVALPVTSSSFLGSPDHYSDIDGDPALYQQAAGRSTVTLSGIGIVDAAGDPVSGYSVVTADAESTDAGESITWQSDQNLDLLIHNAWRNGLGNACLGGLTGVGTSTVTCAGTHTSTAKTGTPILVADNPTTISAQLSTAHAGAIAFGVVVSQVKLSQTVVNAYPGDAFRVDVTDAAGASLGSDSSGTGGGTSTGRLSFLSDSSGADVTLSEAATAGSLTNYQDDWSCTRNSGADATLPSGDAGSSAVVSVGIGDFVNCTITETAIPASLSVSTQAAPAVDVNGDGLTDRGDTIAYVFTVTNTGTTPVDHVTVVDPGAGSTTCASTTLAPGEATTCTPTAPYSVTDADVAAGRVHDTATATGNPAGASATITSAVATTDTATTTPQPALSITENATVRDVNSDFQIDLGDTIAWSFRVTNTGNVPSVGPDGLGPRGGLGDLPARAPGSWRAGHLHERCGVHHRPGRRRRRLGHGHRDSQRPGLLRRDRDVGPGWHVHSGDAPQRPGGHGALERDRRQRRRPVRRGRHRDLLGRRTQRRHGDPALGDGDRPGDRRDDLSGCAAGAGRPGDVLRRRGVLGDPGRRRRRPSE